MPNMILVFRGLPWS